MSGTYAASDETCKVGEWVVPRHNPDGQLPRRIVRLGAPYNGSGSATVWLDRHPNPSPRGDLGWWGSCFRLATPEEIAALPIREGDVVVHPKAHECNSDACVHCTVHEAHEECHLGLDPCRHATPEEYRAFVATEGDKPDDADEPLEGSDFGEGVTLDPEKVEHTFQKVWEAIEERADYARSLARSVAALEEQLASLSAALPRGLGEPGFSLRLIRARLEALEAAVQCDHCRTYEHECMCEAEPPAPPEPELPPQPPALYFRATGRVAYDTLRRDDPEKHGRWRVYDPGAPKGVQYEWHYPSLLTTTPPSPPEPTPGANSLRVLWTLFVAVVSLLVGWLGACAFGAL